LEAIKCLAWHLIHSCEEVSLYEKLATIQTNDRKQIFQLIKWCLRYGSRINSELTQQHLDEISRLLRDEDDDKIEQFQFDLAMYVFGFGMEKLRTRLDMHI
jgi:hypothetical protein